jgi:tetratricopeptide (TPR) repeat protein
MASTVALAACATVAPSPPDPVVQQNIDQLRSGHYESGLAGLRASAAGRRPDPTAVFYEGVALNRLGHFGAALQRFDRAAAMGLRHPELAFESGWSLLGLQRWAEAATRLERYERRQPGRGKTSEFLGRAWVGTWQPEKAEAKLKEAMAQDPALAPGALFYLGVLERSRNDATAMRTYIDAMLGSAPDARLVLVVPRTAAPAAPFRYVKPPLANVREGPGTRAKLIIVLKGGVKLDILGEQNGWYLVQLGDGREGWIAASVTTPVAPSNLTARAASRLDAATIETALGRFALNPNPALLVGFDAETVPVPALETDVSALPGDSRCPCPTLWERISDKTHDFMGQTRDFLGRFWEGIRVQWEKVRG